VIVELSSVRRTYADRVVGLRDGCIMQDVVV
jgi:hypothetical protein